MHVRLVKREPDQMVMFRLELLSDAGNLPKIDQYLERHDSHYANRRVSHVTNEKTAINGVRQVIIETPANLQGVNAMFLHLLSEFELKPHGSYVWK